MFNILKYQEDKYVKLIVLNWIFDFIVNFNY